MAEDSSGYKVRATYIAERKKAEFEARKRVEDRGGTITAASSALVTFVFGITVFLTGKDFTKLVSGSAAIILLFALLAFTVSAALGIFVQNAPLKYKAADQPTLESFLQQNALWNSSERDAANDCAWLDIDSIFSLQETTKLKARIATVALSVQALAILLLVVSLAV